MSVNKVILVGNVGKDPEIRYLDESTAIAKFPIATSETYRNRDGERVTNTEWHNVVLWRGLAQVAEKYVRKGSQLYIEGRIKTRSYDDSEGNRKFITEIVGDQMQMLGRRPDDGAQGGSSQGSGTQDSGPRSGGIPGSTMSPPATSAPQTQQGVTSAPSGPASTPQSGQGSTPPNAPAPGNTPSQENGTSPGSEDPFSSGENAPDDLPF